MKEILKDGSIKLTNEDGTLGVIIKAAPDHLISIDVPETPEQTAARHAEAERIIMDVFAAKPGIPSLDEQLIDLAKHYSTQSGVARDELFYEIDVPETKGVPFLDSVFFIDVPAQVKILKYGSLRKKVAMKRSRRHDGAKHTKNSGPFTGSILKTDFVGELMMLRIGMPLKDRHPKVPPSARSKIQHATYVDAFGVKKDLRDLDYMALLKKL
jgi:hypothetical protein